tara:strand:- start:769 stop:1131 length:363 start_codon:yes stop_codon:yes gene_type:complete
MILYHGTSKENAESIKRNEFSFEYIGKNWGSTYGKAIYFTNCYKTAKCYSGLSGVVLIVNIENIDYQKLHKDYSPNDKKHIRQIKSIIMNLLINSSKNCLLNYYENEYIFFKTFKYIIIS